MKRIVSLLILFVATWGAVNARQLTSEQSLARLMQGHHRVASRSNASPFQLQYVIGEGEVNYFYVFSDQARDEAMILGADDLLPTVLAYGLKSFEVSAMPSNMCAWMEQCKAVARRVILQNTPLTSPSLSGEIVEPLLETKWGQDKPYNKLCMEKMGTYVPSGCVATAMAQVMKYWNYPSQGKSFHSYQTQSGVSLNANFAQATYDWNNMLNTYSEYNEAQADAVSLLMYHCGVAVEMEYRAEGSGAQEHDAADALVKYFDYDKSMQLHMRNLYDDEEWQQMLLDELRERRPIIYVGSTKRGEGHCFVCDGFDGNGYFHFNWGWDGVADGYYLVIGDDALHPLQQGTGGSAASNAYTEHNCIITHIMPNQGTRDVATKMIAYALVDSKQGLVPASLLDRDEQTEVTTAKRGVEYLLSGHFINSSAVKVSVLLGAIFRNTATGEEFAYEGYKAERLPIYSGYVYYPVRLDPIAINGEYEVYPAFRALDDRGATCGDWQIMRSPLTDHRYRVQLEGDLPIMQVVDAQLSSANGYTTDDPTLSITIKALQSFTDQRLTITVFDGENSINAFHQPSSTYSLNEGETLTLPDMKLRNNARLDTPLKQYHVYRVVISCLGAPYELGNMAMTHFSFYVDNNTYTSIHSLSTDAVETNEDYFDLQGRRVASPSHGLYIHNGRKILVK